MDFKYKVNWVDFTTYREFLNLSKLEFDIYFYIIMNDNSNIKTISETFTKDRTTIQKIIKKLMRMGLINKIKSIQNRGYRYEYYISLENLKKLKLNVSVKIDSLSLIKDELNTLINEKNKNKK